MANDALASLAHSMQAITSPFRRYLVDLHQRYATPSTEAPNTAPTLLGIAVVTVDGEVFEVGDTTTLFPIQGLSRALIYGLALEDWGSDYVGQRIRAQPVGERQGAIRLDAAEHRPQSPLITTGAMTTTSLIRGTDPTDRLKRILALLEGYTGRSLSLDALALTRAQSEGLREQSIAHFLRHFGLLEGAVKDTVDLFFQHSSVLVNGRDLAMISATLANGGVNPVTGQTAIAAAHVQDVTSVLLTCGLYERSGEWTRCVGMPTHADPNGTLMAVVPQKLGLGIVSPPAMVGTPTQAEQICAAIARDHHLHLFDIYERNQQMLKYLEQVKKVTAAAAALEQDVESYKAESLAEVVQRPDELGQLARVFQHMAAQVQSREQQLKQKIQTLQIEIDTTTRDQQVAAIVQSPSFQNLKEKLDRMKQRREEQLGRSPQPNDEPTQG